MSGNIIVLDDEASYARMIVDLLHEEGFSAVLSTSPVEVVDMLKKKSYDLVVADYKMPELDGAEFLVEARKIRPSLPVIMISGMMNTPELIKVANIGVTLVLEKPFSRDIFIEYVSRFVTPGEPSTEESTQNTPAKGENSAGSYPPNLHHLSDSCGSSALAIQRLWSALANELDVFVCMPDESEFELLVSEVARWRGIGSERVPKINVRSLFPVEVLRQLREEPQDTEKGVLVAVSGANASPAEQLLSALRFIPEARETEGLSDVSFLYGFFGLDPSGEFPDNERLPSLIKGNLIYFPPLHVRPLDWAVYARRIIESRGGGRTLELDAARLLLQHPVSQSYGALEELLSRACRASPLREITVSVLRTLLPDLPSEVEPLEKYLRNRQNKFLRYQLRREEEMRTAAERSGVELDVLESDSTWDGADELLSDVLRQ